MLTYGAIEKAAFFARDGVDLRLVSKRKNVCWKKDGRSRLAIARRLRKTMIEASAARSGDVRENSVQRNAAFFVGVESLVKKVTQKSAVL